MENINKQINVIEKLKISVVEQESVLDKMIHQKFLEANNLNVNSEFVVNGRTIGETFVKDRQVKGYFLKKDGTLSKSLINITVDVNFKIVR